MVGFDVDVLTEAAESISSPRASFRRESAYILPSERLLRLLIGESSPVLLTKTGKYSKEAFAVRLKTAG